MPNLQRYTSLNIDYRDNSNMRPFPLFKWLYRRYVRQPLFGSSQWSYNCLLLMIITFFIFMIFSTHLYMGLPYQSLSDSVQSVRSSGISSDKSSSNLNRSRFSISNLWESSFSAQLEAAKQIDRTLEKIEQSLQENREILKQIRTNIHLAELKVNVGEDIYSSNSKLKNSSTLDDYFDSVRLKDFQFYPTNNSLSLPLCHNHGSISKSMIQMKQVYEDVPFDNQDGGVWKQGWNIEISQSEFSRSARPKLKVFVVAHSHNDPGWIKTFDTYFRDQTKHILTNTIEQMRIHDDLRFIWAESSYLSAWWETAPTESHRELLKQFIRDGRFEIVTGGWVMNDEANTHYFSILAQMIEGHEWLKDTFDVTPRYSWAIDPFGLSATMAYLLKRMDFNGMVIQRVHYSIKKYLAQNQELEFRWKQPWESSSSHDDILCHLQPFYSYDIPHTCGPDPAVCCQFDFKRLPGTRVKCPWKISPKAITDENIEERANMLLDQYRKKSKLYKTNSLLVPLGDDFRYDKAKEWNDQYTNYKKLMDYMNSNPEMNVEIKFATISDYFTSLFNDTGSWNSITKTLDRNILDDSFPSLSGDFFTYSDRDDHYWSGYFTSKPFYKRFERILESHLRATEILFSLANLVISKTNDEDPFGDLIEEFIFARQNFALFQHHDGITGTAKDFVVQDYAKRMLKSFKILEKITSASIRAIASWESGTKFDLDPLGLNLEFMDRFHNFDKPTSKKTFSIDSSNKNYFILYNSLGWVQESQVFCFVITWKSDEMPTNWYLTNVATGKIIDDLQINHRWNQMNQLIRNEREVCFQPKLEPISLEQFCIGNCGRQLIELKTLYQKKESFTTIYNYHQRPDSMVPSDSHILALMSIPSKEYMIENERIVLKFDQNTGWLTEIGLLDPVTEKWIRMKCKMQLMAYGTRSGNKNVPKSGAYIFLPDQSEPKPFSGLGKPKIHVTVGRIESRYEMIFTEPMPIYIRFTLYRGRRSIDLQTEFHLQGLYGANKELLIRFTIPKLNNQELFYTDLNGFQIITRKRYDKIPIQGNVYPLNTMTFIESNRTNGNSNLRFNVLTGQPLGVTSSSSGTLDIFLDRRLTQDDSRGLSQGVIDNKATRENLRLLFETPALASQTAPRLTSAATFESQSLLNPLIGIVQNDSRSGDPLLPLNASKRSFLRHSLPCDLHLLNLRRSTKKPDEIGLLLHRFGFSCDSICPSPSKIFSINQLFSSSILDKLDQKRLIPTGISLLEQQSNQSKRPLNLETNFTIDPMEIVAFKMYKN